MDEEKPKFDTDTETEVWTAIEAFEQILQAMPDDRASLDSLASAYEKLGDHAQAVEYLLRLADVLVGEGDAQMAATIVGRMQKYDDLDPRVSDKIAQVEQMNPQAQQAAPVNIKKPARRVRKTIDITNELALAWNLVQANELAQDDYSSVVQDLTESSTGNVDVTVSVLHALADRDFKGLPSVMAHIAMDTGVPIISTANFEIDRELAELLPIEFVVRRGALVFSSVADNALVCVLNPYDRQLHDDVLELLDRNCHIYLTSPADFDAAVETVKELLR